MQRTAARNLFANILGEGLWGLQANMVSSATVLPLLLRRYGAGSAMIASIASIETGAVLTLQVAGIYLFRTPRTRKRGLLWWHALAIIPFLALMGLLAGAGQRLPPAIVRWAVLAAFAAYTGSIGLVLSTWLDWLAHIFGPGTRGRALGLSFCASAAMGALGALLAGRVLRSSADPWALLYGTAALLAWLSIGIFTLVDDTASRSLPAPPLVPPRDLLRHLAQSLRHRNFRAFLIGRILTTVGFCMVPLMTVYYGSATGGALSGAQIVSAGSAMAIGAAVANVALGTWGDRRGYRAGLLIAAGSQAAALGLMLTSGGAWSCWLAYAAVGIAAGGGSISHLNLLYETCPHEDRVAHITVGNLVIGLGGIAAPLCAGQIALRWGIRPLFLVCLVFSVGAVLWYRLAFQDPRRSAGQPRGGRANAPKRSDQDHGEL